MSRRIEPSQSLDPRSGVLSRVLACQSAGRAAWRGPSMSVTWARRDPDFLADLQAVLRKRPEEILKLEPQQADGQRLRKRYAKCKEGLLVFVTDREVPFTNNESERALRLGVIFRKVTNGTRSEWGAEFFAAARSVIGTGRLNGLSPFEAITHDH